VLIMEHEPRRFRERVEYITSPGHFPGRRRGGPATLITTLGVFDLSTGRVRAASLHPGVTPRQVREATGFPIAIDEQTPATAAPSIEELAYIRHADPEGFWTGDSMKTG
jgi:glutaconate CoA-transferase subunit B